MSGEGSRWARPSQTAPNRHAWLSEQMWPWEVPGTLGPLLCRLGLDSAALLPGGTLTPSLGQLRVEQQVPNSSVSRGFMGLLPS